MRTPSRSKSQDLSGVPLPAALLALLGLHHGAVAQTTYPNSILIRSYTEPGFVHSASDKYTFKNGMGQEFQAFTREGIGDIVSGTKFDRYGRPYLDIKPYYSESFGHIWSAADLQAQANAYHDGSTSERRNAGGRAYRETEYYPDPLKRAKAVGEPGYAFSLAGGKAARFWYLGLTLPTFLSAPTIATLDAWKPAPANNFAYFLEVVRDPNGNYSQVIKDRQGRVIKTWADPNPALAGDEIQTLNVYDGKGNLIRTQPPGPGGLPDPNTATHSTFVYSTDGRLLSERHPDQGLIEYVHDKQGRVRFTRREKQRDFSAYYTSFNYTKYDPLGRDIEHGVVLVPSANASAIFHVNYANMRDWPTAGNAGAIPAVKIRKVYDRADELLGLMGNQASMVGGMYNLRGRLAATIAYDEFGQGPENRVVDIFSYDAEGRVDRKEKFIPTLRKQKFEYIYDLQGKVKYKIHSWAADAYAPSSITWEYSYDPAGRLVEILREYSPVVRYAYTKTGLLARTEYWKDGALIGQQSKTYTVRDWLENTEAKNTTRTLYSENLRYEGAGGAGSQYNGNISAIDHYYAFTSGPWTYSYAYGYDGANRLVSRSGSTPEAFQFDAKGRITHKTEGTTAYGPYEYGPNDNRLLKVGGHPTRNHANGNFVYDPDGNMVFDRSKKMSVAYDWRGLPVKFRIHSTVPEALPTWQNANSLPSVVSEVEMTYDADGQRVLKRTNRFN